MPLNETQSSKQIIEPALTTAGWQFDGQVRLGPARVRIAGPSMYDSHQEIILDYHLHSNGVALLSNSRDYILIDLSDGSSETLTTPPSPALILRRLGYTIDAALWAPVFARPWLFDQIAKKKVRDYQEASIFKALRCFAQGITRVLLLMATGTGKTFTNFQLVWKLSRGGVLKHNRILLLTERNNHQEQASRAFSGQL